MEILIERRRYSADEYDVIAYDRAGRITRVYTLGEDGRLVGNDVNEVGVIGDELVLMRVHRDFFEALARAASEVVPASDATTAHLKDAVGVRDRLLALVEEGWHP